MEGWVVAQGQRGSFRNEYGDKMFHKNQTLPIGGVERITVYRDNYGRFVKKTVTTTHF